VQETFRPPLWQRLVCTVPVVGQAILFGFAAPSEQGVVRPLCLLGVLAAVAVSWRGWLLRVELGEDVTVVNWIRTVRIPWAEVERFGYDLGVWVRRRDGRQYAIAALTLDPRALPFVRRRVARTARQLETGRRRRRRSSAVEATAGTLRQR
jgi:hypothetical protein